MTACPGLGACNKRFWRAEALHKVADARYHADVNAVADGVKVLAEGEPAPQRPEPHSIRPVDGEPVWCATSRDDQPSCTARIRVMLAELDDLAAHLAQLPPGVRPAVNLRREQERVTSTRSPRSPSPGGDTLTELQAWLLHYETRYRTFRGWPPPPLRGVIATVRTTVICWLGTHLDGLLTTTFAEPFGVELADWHGELKAATHADAVAHHVKQACPRVLKGCGKMTLWYTPGDDYAARCVDPNCNRVYTQDDFDNLAKHPRSR